MILMYTMNINNNLFMLIVYIKYEMEDDIMIKNIKYYIVIGICCCLIGALFYKNSTSKDNGILTDEDIFNELFYYEKLDKKNIVYDSKNGQIVNQQLLIETDDISKENIEKIVEKYKGNVIGYIASTHSYQIEFNKKSNLDDIKKKLEETKHITHVSYNYVMHLENQSITYPNDQRWINDWSTTADGGNWGLEAVSIPETWNYLSKKKLEDVQIGVFECFGFQEDHEDLKNNVYSVLGNYSQTDKNHGTAVSGIIAAEYNNDRGISGITMNKGKIDYYSYYGVNSAGYNDLMSFKIGLTDLVVQAKKNNQTAIINMSLGDSLLNFSVSHGNQNAIDELKEFNEELENYLSVLLKNENDFLIVKSSGNSNNEQYLTVDYNKDDENTYYGFIPYTTNKKSDDYKKYSY